MLVHKTFSEDRDNDGFKIPFTFSNQKRRLPIAPPPRKFVDDDCKMLASQELLKLYADSTLKPAPLKSVTKTPLKQQATTTSQTPVASQLDTQSSSSRIGSAVTATTV